MKHEYLKTDFKKREKKKNLILSLGVNKRHVWLIYKYNNRSDLSVRVFIMATTVDFIGIL